MAITQLKESGDPVAETPVAAPKSRRRRGPLRRRARKVVEVTHRWTAFILGVALLAIALSGVVLTWGPELHRLINSEQYSGTETADPIGFDQALADLERQAPDFDASEAVLGDGVYSIYDADYVEQAHIDASTGEYLGTSSMEGGFMGLMRNVHFCALGCKEYPGYVPFLGDKVKNSFVPTFGNNALTWGGLLLALTGLLFIFLSIGGIWLWWPSIKRFASGFKVRRSNRYKLNYDLHKVVGIVAVPFLIMWGVTGAGFELKQIPDAWYALMPGDAPKGKEFDTLVSKPKADPVEPEARDGEITLTEGEAIAARTAGDDAEPVSAATPVGRTGTFSYYFADGSDPYEYGNFPGDLQVLVDRYSGASVISFPANPGAPLGEELWEGWSYSVHAGFFANPFWRIFWGVFGAAVLLLGVTSTITWFIRWRKRRAKGKRASKALQAEAEAPE